MTQYVVRQGDSLPTIAAAFGFASYRTVWEHPENAELRALRADPTVLLPGDVVFIPDVKAGSATVATGQAHRFKLARPKLLLRLRVLDLLGQPLANTPCTLVLDEREETVGTDGDGVLTHEIPVHLQTATLKVADTQYELLIGHLDPHDQPTGLLARLNNLGYVVGAPGEEVEEEDLALAVRLFQWDHGLTIDGVVTPALMEAVRDAFGG